MESLTEGLKPDISIERRPELVLEPPSTLNNLETKGELKLEENLNGLVNRNILCKPYI